MWNLSRFDKTHNMFQRRGPRTNLELPIDAIAFAPLLSESHLLVSRFPIHGLLALTSQVGEAQEIVLFEPLRQEGPIESLKISASLANCNDKKRDHVSYPRMCAQIVELAMVCTLYIL